MPAFQKVCVMNNYNPADELPCLRLVTNGYLLFSPWTKRSSATWSRVITDLVNDGSVTIDQLTIPDPSIVSRHPICLKGRVS